MDIHDQVKKDLLFAFSVNLYEKVQSQKIFKQAVDEYNPDITEVSKNYREYNTQAIDCLKKVANQHDINLSYKVLQVYHENEIENAQTLTAKKFSKGELKKINRCEKMINHIQCPENYLSTLNNNLPEAKYMSGLPNEVVTRTLMNQIDKFNQPLQTLKVDTPSHELYTELKKFTNSMLVDYQKLQLQNVAYEKAVEKGLIERKLTPTKEDRAIMQGIATQNEHKFKFGKFQEFPQQQVQQNIEPQQERTSKADDIEL